MNSGMINSIIELVLDYWTPERKELWKEYEKTDKSIPWQEYEHLRKETCAVNCTENR